MANSLKLLVLWSLLYLASSMAGTLLAIRDHLPAEFGGILHGDNVPVDFLTWMGTALSPPLVMLIAQVVFMALDLRPSSSGPGRTGVVGVAGLAILGTMYTLGQLGEPILFRSFNPPRLGMTQLILATNILFALLMLIFGLLECKSRKQENDVHS